VTTRASRIALFRAREEAERSAAGLAERGLTSVIAPVTRARATHANLPQEDFDIVVATSAKAFELISAAAREAIARLPLFVVGAQSARAAAAKGLRVAEPPASDAAALTERLRPRLQAHSRVLYLAGRDRRSELELALGQAGHSVAPVEIYTAEARTDWTAREAEAVSRCDAALHYSLRSAELAARLAARAGIADRFRALLHICISEDAAAPLLAIGATNVGWAKSPQQNALFEALARALQAEGTADR
jgi:uroporphyrinogen-III synthase